MSSASQPPQTSPPAQKPSRAARPIMIATAVLGGLTILSLGAMTALGAVMSGRGSDGSRATSNTLAVAGITGVEIDSNAAKVTLTYGNVARAELDVNGTHGDGWKLSREDDELKVESPREVFGWIGPCSRGCFVDIQTVTLTLPRELKDRALDIDASLSAGELILDGNFRDASVEVSAGRATLTGSARSLHLDMTAGSFSSELSNVREASFDVSAGDARVELTGVTPHDVGVDVSAGSVDLRVPNDSYRVNTQVSAGSIDNRLRTDPSSQNLMTAEVSAGKITLRSRS